MANKGVHPTYKKEDFMKWVKWKKSGMEIALIAERCGASYGYVCKKIKEYSKVLV
jgi:hypothetical protein